MTASKNHLANALKKALLPYRGHRVILAFSGGLDSVVLGQTLMSVAPSLAVEWALGHVDHGPTADSRQRSYRDASVRKAHDQGSAWGVPVYVRAAPTPLTESEEAFRRFRYEMLEDIRREAKAAKILTAHHRDDLLETRLLRLIRGTGPYGLRAMDVSSGQLLRPWLDVGRREIEDFARRERIEEIIDPSNSDLSYLRNWIRNDWLPQLEARQTGATSALGRSLEHIAALSRNGAGASGQSGSFGSEWQDGPWNRRQFRDVSAAERKAAVAQKLRILGAKDFTQGQIEEVVKRLDTVQKRLEFTVGGIRWRLNAQQIYAEPI